MQYLTYLLSIFNQSSPTIYYDDDDIVTTLTASNICVLCLTFNFSLVLFFYQNVSPD